MQRKANNKEGREIKDKTAEKMKEMRSEGGKARNHGVIKLQKCMYVTSWCLLPRCTFICYTTTGG